MVAPFRGKDSRFGTNPLCVIFPREGQPPLLLDYATSAIAFGKTRVAWHKGEAVPPGSLIDARGEPTTDPAVMQTSPLGALLTFAQHKGYALATLCEILGGAVSGGQTTHQQSLQTCVDAIFNCMTTIILDPQAFDAPDMQRETEAFIDWCKQSPSRGARADSGAGRMGRGQSSGAPGTGHSTGCRQLAGHLPSGAGSRIPAAETGAVSAQNGLAPERTPSPGVLLRHRH